ncbi:MAG: choice-of-anchor tandem repeat GloVer-containing protein [Bryobacteraceae bacterium]
MRPIQAQSRTYQTIYSFQAGPDGRDPKGALIVGRDGALYGTTNEGGASADGTVFELKRTAENGWTESVIYNFSGPDGRNPASTLMPASNGTLYGTTSGGGSIGPGTVFQLTPPQASGDPWVESVLYSFTGGGQDACPNGELLGGPGGILFATTEGDGCTQGGTGLVVSLIPPTTPGAAWTEHQIFYFDGATGELPHGGVVSEGGSLFGTAFYDPDNENCDCGTIYELTPPAIPGHSWTYTLLHTYTSGPPNIGEFPAAPLAAGPGGVLYGTTRFGGSSSGSVNCDTSDFSGCGTVFQLTPPSSSGGSWSFSVIYNFTGANGDGAQPLAGVIVGEDGTIYGTAHRQGTASPACPGSKQWPPGCGMVFQLTPPTTAGGAWTETVLHDFTGENGDGAFPIAALALSASGVLYGTTPSGGTEGRGTVFVVAP